MTKAHRPYTCASLQDKGFKKSSFLILSVIDIQMKKIVKPRHEFANTSLMP